MTPDSAAPGVGGEYDLVSTLQNTGRGKKPSVAARSGGQRSPLCKAEASDYCHCLPSEITTTSSGSSDAESQWNAGRNKAITKGQKSAVALAVVVIAILIAVIISLAVSCQKPCPPCLSTASAACPDFWIGYRRKCFYVAKEERNWSLSLKTCSSLNASLAVIDTQKELDFWVEIFSPFHYWFGLSRKINQVWKWFNGTEFKNQFAVRGEGFCAYVDGKGASSTMCSMEKRFLCSRPESCNNLG